MNRRLNKVFRIIIGVALAVTIWIVGILIGQEQTVVILNPEGGLGGLISRSKFIKVDLMVDHGNGVVEIYRDVQIENNETVLQALKRVSQKNDLKLDYVIDQTGQLSQLAINSQANTLSGLSWQAWKNFELQGANLNHIQLNNKDHIVLQYIKLK